MSEGNVLITGANGFIGTSLCKALLERKFLVQAVIRSAQAGSEFLKSFTMYSSFLKCIIQPDFVQSQQHWIKTLKNVDTIIHLAARVHILNDTDVNSFAEYYKVNVIATKILAEAAAAAGVRRFIYISSIKVNGEGTKPNQYFTELDKPNPQDHYAQSKWQAEQVLREMAATKGLEIVILRPPLVYGLGVKGNFQQLIGLVQRGWPLPLASVNNFRSLIYVGNLVDAILLCMNHAKAANQTYLVSDNEDVSTPELIRRLALVFNNRLPLLPFPPKLLQLAAKLFGKQLQLERLLGSLQIDNSKIFNMLQWHPPYAMQEALLRDFAESKGEARKQCQH